MKPEPTLDIRLDANGDPDARFYLAQAHAIRNRAIRDGLVAMVAAFRHWLARPLIQAPGRLVHH
jgi:hypothetical protein